MQWTLVQGVGQGLPTQKKYWNGRHRHDANNHHTNQEEEHCKEQDNGTIATLSAIPATRRATLARCAHKIPGTSKGINKRKWRKQRNKERRMTVRELLGE